MDRYRPFCLHPLRILTWKAPSATTHGQCDVNPNYAAESKSCENCFLSFIKRMKHLCPSSVFSWTLVSQKQVHKVSDILPTSPDNILQCLTACYSVLQCITIYYYIDNIICYNRLLQHIAIYHNILYNILQYLILSLIIFTYQILLW